MRSRTKVLVVDDEEPICEILRFNLVAEGISAGKASAEVTTGRCGIFLST